METRIILKNGHAATLRRPTPDDAAGYLELRRALAVETAFMLWEPEELASLTETEEAAFIRHKNADPCVEMIVCQVDGIIAGESRIAWDPRKRIRHRAQIMFGIRRDFWGQGIAGAMFDMLLRTARENRITQLELDVRADNIRAIAFYRKMGFRETGTIPHALRQRDGTCHDLRIMVRDI